MSISPFASFANATLTFKIPIWSGGISDLGNPQVSSTSDLVVTAMLSEKTDNSARDNDFHGTDDRSLNVEGRCIDPMTLPVNIVPGVKAEAAIAGRQGEFFLAASIPSPYGTDAILGQAIKGRFVQRVIWGEPA